MQETFTLNRTGKFKLLKTSSNQCRQKGHQAYEYHIQLVVKSNTLDKQGFIVDHVVIDDAVQKVTKKATSCELLCKRICKGIEQSLSKRNLKFKSIHVQVKATPNPLAWMEFTMKSK
jgi:hypothetical protein